MACMSLLCCSIWGVFFPFKVFFFLIWNKCLRIEGVVCEPNLWFWAIWIKLTWLWCPDISVLCVFVLFKAWYNGICNVVIRILNELCQCQRFHMSFQFTPHQYLQIWHQSHDYSISSWITRYYFWIFGDFSEFDSVAADLKHKSWYHNDVTERRLMFVPVVQLAPRVQAIAHGWVPFT